MLEPSKFRNSFSTAARYFTTKEQNEKDQPHILKLENHCVKELGVLLPQGSKFMSFPTAPFFS
jgi:hypothetical protein